MQSSGRVSRSKANKHHFDDEYTPEKKKHAKAERSSNEVKRDLENYFERKKLREWNEDYWN